jgi:tartrate dehydratase alpha subunit/fumarate hydratase class I-like protein
MKLETAAVRRRYWREQEERNQKIQREYLRMLNKKMNLGYLTLEEAFLEADEETRENLCGAEWHISYFKDADKKKIEAVMNGFGCRNFTLHHSIDECIGRFKE